jgi:branched-chain amino acid transport system substrate-binding protein
LITADVQHNARNLGKEIMYFNVGAEVMEFTGSKCHFYHFRWNGTDQAARDADGDEGCHVLGNKVYVIGQN